MEKNVEVEISYSDKDIKQAIAYIINRVYKIWVVLLCITIGIVAVLFYGIIEGFNDSIYWLSFAYIILLLIFYNAYYRRPIHGYLGFYRKRKGGIYTFANSDVKIIGEEVQSIVAWSIFKKVYDIPSAFVLADGNKFLYVFPKKCFKSSSDIEVLRQLLSDKIHNYKRFD